MMEANLSKCTTQILFHNNFYRHHLLLYYLKCPQHDNENEQPFLFWCKNEQPFISLLFLLNKGLPMLEWKS